MMAALKNGGNHVYQTTELLQGKYEQDDKSDATLSDDHDNDYEEYLTDFEMNEYFLSDKEI